MPITAGSQLLVVHPFTAEGEGELTVAANAIVTVLEPESEASAGWLHVRAQDGRIGYVPMDFLQVVAGGAETESSFKEKAAQRMSVVMPPAAVLAQQQSARGLGNIQYPNVPQYQPPAQAAMAWGAAPPAAPTTTYGASMGAEAWAQRDRLYGTVRTPIPPGRRWYYRDLFGDMQGPFNPQEMRQRVDAKHIQAETFCVIEVGSGATQRHEEKKLRDLFPNMDVAFLQPPVLGGSRMFWFYLDDAKQEMGPFSADQMRLWFDVEGYFGSSTLVREAVPGSNFAPLRQYFPDPMTCFLDGTPPSQPASQAPQGGYADQTSFQVFDPFTVQTAQPASSSRDLLKAALAGGPPPAIGKGSTMQAPPPAKAISKSFEDDEDDTLALFDKIELSTEEDKKADKKKPAALRVYGNPTMWPAWKGVPNFAAKPDAFPTILYHFFTRPLNPNAGKILCHITREIDGIGHFNYNKFVLYLENETGPQPTAIGIRHYGPMSTTFDIKLLTNGRVDDVKSALTIAKMEVNFMGTQFVLHNAVQGHQGRAKDLCCVLYEANRMGKGGPRRMRVGIPDIDETKPEFKVFPHGASGDTSMLGSLQHINATNLIPMLNKPPKWNEAKKAYSLDFGGRVTRASVKNFQLVDAIHDPEHTNVILQHGRVAQDKFTMDVQHPMSLLQAFAVCLSSLHQKKAVD